MYVWRGNGCGLEPSTGGGNYASVLLHHQGYDAVWASELLLACASSWCLHYFPLRVYSIISPKSLVFKELLDRVALRMPHLTGCTGAYPSIKHASPHFYLILLLWRVDNRSRHVVSRVNRRMGCWESLSVQGPSRREVETKAAKWYQKARILRAASE